MFAAVLLSLLAAGAPVECEAGEFEVSESEIAVVEEGTEMLEEEALLYTDGEEEIAMDDVIEFVDEE